MTGREWEEERRVHISSLLMAITDTVAAADSMRGDDLIAAVTTEENVDKTLTNQTNIMLPTAHCSVH